MKTHANLSFTGIPTFCRTPYVESIDSIPTDIAILGIPFDEGVGFRPGTRFGPRAIREYSMRFPYFDPAASERGYFDFEKKKRLLSGPRIVDCGDVDIVPLDYEYVYERIDEAVKKIIDRGVFPVLLGGDHSISYPIVSAFEKMGPLDVVQLDAHLDRRDAVLGVKFGHGSPIRRIGELSFIEKIISVGMRGLRAPEKDYQDAVARGDLIISSQEVQESGIESVLKKIGKLGRCYVTIDIDVLDPSIAPGTGTPEADGLTYFQAKKILQGIAERSTIVGFDLVEVNPGLDLTGRTPLFAAQLCVEFLAAIFR